MKWYEIWRIALRCHGIHSSQNSPVYLLIFDTGHMCLVELFWYVFIVRSCISVDYLHFKCHFQNRQINSRNQYTHRHCILHTTANKPYPPSILCQSSRTTFYHIEHDCTMCLFGSDIDKIIGHSLSDLCRGTQVYEHSSRTSVHNKLIGARIP